MAMASIDVWPVADILPQDIISNVIEWTASTNVGKFSGRGDYLNGSIEDMSHSSGNNQRVNIGMLWYPAVWNVKLHSFKFSLKLTLTSAKLSYVGLTKISCSACQSVPSMCWGEMHLWLLHRKLNWPSTNKSWGKWLTRKCLWKKNIKSSRLVGFLTGVVGGLVKKIRKTPRHRRFLFRWHGKIMQLVDPKMLQQQLQQQQVPAPVNPIHRNIFTLDQNMQAILQRTDLSDEEKVRQYNQVLRRSLEYHDHLRAPPPATPSVTTPLSKDIEEEVLAIVPKQSMMKWKAQDLLERIYI